MSDLFYSPGLWPRAFAPLAGLLSIGTFSLLSYATHRVGTFRKLSGIKYPQANATIEQVANSPAAKLFNCARMAHANTLENLAAVIPCTIVFGIRYPNLAAACYTVWLAGRFLYIRGYTTGDPGKRMQGGFAYLGLFPIVFGALGVCIEGFLHGR